MNNPQTSCIVRIVSLGPAIKEWGDVEPEKDRIRTAARPVCDDHLFVGDQDWLVRRVTMGHVGDDDVVVHAQYNGKAYRDWVES